ncbi:MAG: leucine-rich repeat domain-containing protein, partial [Clostridia bacterium]|nr:leucine-rich repeat domain-containing protein [Clostridia bacterium]
NITIPNNITTIASWVFLGCTELTKIIIPNNVINIEGYSFSNCKSLQSINIPNSVKNIRYRAFSNCTSLQTITIPDSVTIGEWAFENCTSLTLVKCQKKRRFDLLKGFIKIGDCYFNERNFKKLNKEKQELMKNENKELFEKLKERKIEQSLKVALSSSLGITKNDLLDNLTKTSEEQEQTM